MLIETEKTELVELFLNNSVLQFGDFTLKSGRKSPYFFNMGLIKSAHALDRLCFFYAQSIARLHPDLDCVIGAAYKGIPLCVMTAHHLSTILQRDIGFGFNRKEAKAHGEGGQWVGNSPTAKSVCVDDVITAGSAVESMMQLWRENLATPPLAWVVALDREEPGTVNKSSALRQVAERFNMPTISLISLSDVINALDQMEKSWRIHAQILKSHKQTFSYTA
ncbi:MAG: orotate phosphoribosyltransferase [Pseudomonadota bacterium]